MSIFHNTALIGSSGRKVAATGISRSLRFNSADSAYLSRTPASASNRTTYTFACWAKRATLTVRQMIFSATNGGDADAFYFHEDNTLRFHQKDGLDSSLITTQVFRDASAWYHLLVSVDTTQGTSSNRIKLYVNGVQVTALSTATYPSPSYTGGVNNNVAHNIGRRSSGSDNYLSAYLADIHFIDGQALDPSSFTETDATTGQLIPKAYTGSYGTNGFNLEFSDNSGTTSTTLGKDSAGSNNWTPNNLSVTAGAGNDSLVDVPTNGAQTDTGVGGEVRGNYCTWNPLFSSSFTYTNGNLDITSANSNAHGTIGVSTGKWYWEGVPTTVGNTNNSFRIGVRTTGGTYTAYVRNRTSDLQYGTQAGDGGTADSVVWQANTVYGLALDCDNSQLKVYKSNNLIATVSIQSSQTWFPWFGAEDTSATWVFNWGARPFAYTAPSGFKALCTANLPAPLVTKPNTVMDVKLYTGTGSTQTISGLGFSPDFVWTKSRSNAYAHAVFDVIRGATNRLETDSTSAAYTEANSLTAFNSDGFTLGGANGTNANSATYAAWAWDAGSSTVTNNTAGTITPTGVRANATAGFSIVTYTGNGSNSTVGHGLGVAPGLIIVKARSRADSWRVYHSALGATKYLTLDSTAAAGTVSSVWNDTAPTSTVFSIGTESAVNTNGATQVAYCFAPVVGYSSFGSYTGNGSSTDGPFVYTGFRPRYILIKNSSAVVSWAIYDTARMGGNAVISFANALRPQTADNEANGLDDNLDILSNGFKIRDSRSALNGNTNTIIYAAFAESPFNYSRAR